MRTKKEIWLWPTVIAGTVLLIQTTTSYKGTIQMSNIQAQNQPKKPGEYAKATFAAGCFWHVQYEFDRIAGVVSTTVGFTGGTTENPTYKQVCTDKTGHAEAVEIIYDPNKVSYEKLLEIFFKNHDPTTLNRQGPDVGSQYRSAIFYHTDGQRRAAVSMLDRLSQSGKFTRPVVTQLKPAGPFYKAEDYHQKYIEKTGAGYKQ